MSGSKKKKGGSSVVARGALAISDTYTALLYELAFTAMRSVSGYCCKLSNVELG